MERNGSLTDAQTNSESDGKSPVQRFRTVIAGAIIVALAFGLTRVPVIVELALQDIDALHWLRENIAPQHLPPDQSPTVVVAIDESTQVDETLGAIPRVMWTPQFATVQNAVMNADAAVFGWDIILPTSANTYVADKRFDQPFLKSLNVHGKKRGRLLLGETTFGIFDGSGRVTLFRPFSMFRRVVGNEPNVRTLLAHPDEDGGVRGIPLFVEQETQTGEVALRTSMSFEMASRMTGQPTSIDEKSTIRLGDRTIPSFGDKALRLNFDTGPGSIPTFAFADLVRCAESGNTEYFEKHFKGKAVLLGLVTDIEDRKVSSNAWVNHADFTNAPPPCTEGYAYAPAEPRSTIPGVYLHATAVNNVVLGNALRDPSLATKLLCVLFIAGITTAIALAFRPQRAAPIAVLLGFAWILLATFAFRETYILPLSSPLIALLFCLGTSIGYRFVTTDKERALIHEAFKFYLDPSVIDEMIDSGAPPTLGGETREVTVVFTDIAGFSSFSETLPPEDLISFLNEYFNIFDEELRAHSGILDKYIGDAVMAIFGAPKEDPDHAKNAVACCLAIQKRLAENQDVFKRYLVNLPPGTEVITRIGINSGVMTVGNVGGAQRANYTVFGDNVNLSARLESVNKQFGTTLLVGDRTWDLCKDEFEWRIVDRVRVVGRDTPVTMRQPLGAKDKVSNDVLEYRDRFEAGLALRWERKFDESAEIFGELTSRGDEAGAKALAWTQEIAGSSPADDWDGVLDLDKK